jgi:hypothetical protein
MVMWTFAAYAAGTYGFMYDVHCIGEGLNAGLRHGTLGCV